jgi:hypothetical protein
MRRARPRHARTVRGKLRYERAGVHVHTWQGTACRGPVRVWAFLWKQCAQRIHTGEEPTHNWIERADPALIVRVFHTFTQWSDDLFLQSAL